MAYVVALTTTDSQKSARAMAKALVGEGIVACVNIVPGAESIYKWKGKICREAEWLLIMKAHQTQVTRLKRRLPELHHYECPELIVLPITAGHGPYLEWIKRQSS